MYAVRYDGFGRVQKVQAHLKTMDYDLIQNNLVKPLTEVPVYAPDRIRTQAEALIDIAGLWEKSSEANEQEKAALRVGFKTCYLSGEISKQTFIDLRNSVTSSVGKQYPLFIEKMDAIIESIEKDFYITKHNDNYYGRLFDSELASYVINNPTEEMTKVSALLKKHLLSDFKKYTSSSQEILCLEIANALSEDNAPWQATIEQVAQFLEKKPKTGIIDDFYLMLESDSPYKTSLILSLAVKYICFANNFHAINIASTKLYNAVIVPQKNLLRVKNSNELGTRHGILLHYQRKEGPQIELGNGVRPIDRYQPPVSKQTEHDQHALMHERAIGISMSGSAHILNNLFLDLQKTNEHFPMESAKLMTAAHLTFSGGHSINEAYSSFEYQGNKNFQPLPYQSLSDRSDAAAAAVEHAYKAILAISQRLN